MKDLKKFNGRELALHHVWLMDELEQLPPGTKISLAKKKEIEAYEKELQHRLEKNLIGDVIPVRPTVRQILRSPKPIEEKAEGPLISFHFEAFSGINTRIKKFKIDATTKKEAWKKAREKTKDYPGQVNLKVS